MVDKKADEGRGVTGEISRVARDGREFEFSDADFERIRELIYAIAGIALSDMKRDLVYGRLARRLRACGLRRFTDYLNLVERGDAQEREAFINSLTTNLTSFFREAHHFPLLARQAAERKGSGPFRVWCSASSTGEEAYSIAITLADAFQGRLDRFEVVASDLDTQVLATARTGIYPQDRAKGIPVEQLRRYFRRGSGRNEGLVRIRRELIQRIEFLEINLLAPKWPDLPVFDAIFCRNVMIYFDKDTQRRLLQRFVPLLQPQQGRLYCGHSESLMHCADFLKNLGKTVYTVINRPL